MANSQASIDLDESLTAEQLRLERPKNQQR